MSGFLGAMESQEKISDQSGSKACQSLGEQDENIWIRNCWTWELEKCIYTFSWRSWFHVPSNLSVITWDKAHFRTEGC